MIRVLQVFFSMNCGGAENMLMNLYRKIDREKVQFDFVVHTDRKSFFEDEILSMGGRIYRAPKYNFVNHFKYKKWWNKFLCEHKEYGVIHGHLYSIAPIYLGVARKYGLKTIIHSHSASDRASMKNILKAYLKSKAGTCADYLFACSEAAGKWLYGRSVSEKENYILLKNAIDTEKYVYNEDTVRKVRDEFKLGDKFVVGHVGRLFGPKNHMYLIDVFCEILKKKPDAMLMLVGTGPMKEEIEVRISERGITESVIMTGVRSDVHRVMQAMDCFAFPSLYEGLPVTVVEAQTASLPCFVSDAVTDEICITNLVKRLSIEKSPKEWAEEILKITEIFKKRNTRQEIIDSGYDIASTAEWLENFYLKAGK